MYQKASKVYFNGMGIFFNQGKLDKIHETLSKPIHDLTAKIEKYASKYPLLAQVGVHHVPRILEQGPNVVHLLASMLNDERVSPDAKKSLTMAALYFISPIDLMPAVVMGPIGYLDDILVATYVFNLILNGGNQIDREVLTEMWKGKPADLQMLRDRVQKIDKIKEVVQRFTLRKPK